MARARPPPFPGGCENHKFDHNVCKFANDYITEWVFIDVFFGEGRANVVYLCSACLGLRADRPFDRFIPMFRGMVYEIDGDLWPEHK